MYPCVWMFTYIEDFSHRTTWLDEPVNSNKSMSWSNEFRASTLF